ncbi:hypothetical protein GCM10027046_13860 [Uliginosibacterium flavum]|uniref:O-antigen ligase family protein n=1 Tax=Uliginosibacterium flavum TaxID=1396831 RepID=A0ABV2TQW3_9RHOO
MREIIESINDFVNRRFRAGQSRGWSALFTIAVGGLLVIGLSVFFGMAAGVMPWWLMIGVGLGPIVLIVTLRWPLASMFLFFSLVFEAIPARFIPGLGSFRVYELLLILLFVHLWFDALWRSEPFWKPLGQFRVPLLYLVFCLSMSVLYVKFYAPNPNLLTELRGFVCWLSLPILCLLIRTRREHHWLVVLAISVGLIVAMYAVIQSFTGVSILSSRLEMLDVRNSDVTRSIAGGGIYLMVFGLIWAVMRWMDFVPRQSLGNLAVAAIAAAGIAVSFGRGVWLAAVVGLLFASWLNRGARGFFSAIFAGSLIVVVALAGLSVVKPRTALAIVDRALGVKTEIEQGGSYGWRALENRQAFAVLARKPLTGVGLGGHYKDRGTLAGGFENETRYIHNAYVGYMVKMGVHAVLFQVLMVFVFGAMLVRLRKRIKSADRPVFCAAAGTFVVPAITSYTQPEWITAQGIVVFCTMSVLVLFYLREHATAPVGGAA